MASICRFVPLVAGLIECQSGSTYVTLSMSVKAFKLVQSGCNNIYYTDKVLKPISEKYIGETQQISIFGLPGTVYYGLCSLPKISQWYSYWKKICYAIMFTFGQKGLFCNWCFSWNSGKALMRKLLDEEIINMGYHDEIVQYLRDNTVCDKRADKPLWWKTNESRFPSVSKLACDILAIQASFVLIESSFSVAGNLINNFRSSSGDRSIANLILKSCKRFLDESVYFLHVLFVFVMLLFSKKLNHSFRC